MQATRKIKGGKLLRIKVDEGVQITGDFFAHPEHSIEKIEDFLPSIQDLSAQDQMKALQTFITTNQFELIGIDAKNIIEVWNEAKA